MTKRHAGIDPRRHQGKWEVSARCINGRWVAAWEPSWPTSEDDVRYWHDCSSSTPKGAIELALDAVAEMDPGEWEMTFGS
jgi:hypothetical protein